MIKRVLNGRRDVMKIKSSHDTFEARGNHMRSISMSGIHRQRLVQGKVLSRAMCFFRAPSILSVE